MKITDIRPIRLWGPLERAQGGRSAMKAKVLVRVETDVGIYGLGEVDDFFGVKDALDYASEYFKGRDPMEMNAIISEFMYGTLPPHPRTAKHGVMANGRPACPPCSPTAIPDGPVVWAASGIEMALCDVVGKALKTPVYTLLGGKFRDRVRIYLDRSAPVVVSNLDAWKKMAADVVKAGFTQMKFDIDYVASDLTHDVWNRSISQEQINRMVERLTVVRETVGWDASICVDCHRMYNVTDAIRIAQALAHLRLTFLEDPTPNASPDSCAEVRARSAIPICAGEMFMAEQFRLFIDRGAMDIIHPDVLFCGGLHEARRIADYADLHHMPMAMHGNGGALATIAAAHVAAASRNFLCLEYHFIDTPWISEIVRRGESLFKDGFVHLTDAPGFGVELNEAICEKYHLN